MENQKFRVNDRVMRSDANDPKSIPAYRDMRGTVTGFDWTRVLVRWDCDGKMPPTAVRPENLRHAREA